MAVHYRTEEGRARCNNPKALNLAPTVEDVDCGACLAVIRKRGGVPLIESALHDGSVGMTHCADGAIYHVPFNDDFRMRLRIEIPGQGLRWVKELRGWFVATPHREGAERLIRAYFGPASWPKAFHLLCLTSGASSALVFLSRALFRRLHAGNPAALAELERCIESLSRHQEADVLAQGRAELKALRLREIE